MKLKTLLNTLIVAIAGYWYFSPFLALWQLDAAAKGNDAVAFNNLVDFPKVRDSIKTQLSGMIDEKLPAPDASNSPMARAGVAFGAALGSIMINGLVDHLVRPETIMRAMQERNLRAKTVVDNTTTPQAQAQGQKRQWTYDREGADKLVAYAVDPAMPNQARDEQFGLVLERSGFATWRLTGLKLSGKKQ